MGCIISSVPRVALHCDQAGEHNVHGLRHLFGSAAICGTKKMTVDRVHMGCIISLARTAIWFNHNPR